MKFPDHKCGMYLTHNEHKDNYEIIAEYLDTAGSHYDFENEQSKNKCIENDEIWTLQWYPETPIGFFSVAAPTLEELISFANKSGD